jgi:hypothetical protein
MFVNEIKANPKNDICKVVFQFNINPLDIFLTLYPQITPFWHNQ